MKLATSTHPLVTQTNVYSIIYRVDDLVSTGHNSRQIQSCADDVHWMTASPHTLAPTHTHTRRPTDHPSIRSKLRHESLISHGHLLGQYLPLSLTKPAFSFSALLLRLQSGASSVPFSSASSPSSFVLWMLVGACSAGE